MRSVNLSLPRLLGLPAVVLLACAAAWPQAAPVPSRVVDRVDENALVTLRGNTHPLAQAQFDRGAAPPDLPMARMLLVLKRSDAQEAALAKLLDDQQDLNSPSYHQWLTPDQFGRQFGPSDQDVQTVVAWLRSRGFQVGATSGGLTVLEFSGTAAQVQQAFHTEIHKYTVNGEDHWANASDPQIPVALAPVVAGVNSLHNFPKQPMYRFSGKVAKPQGAAVTSGSASEFTTPASQCAISGNCYFVGPYDFATVYNVQPLWNATTPIDGTGQSIAILNESNINIQDVRDFRNMFGLPANDPQIILNGPDPGLVQGVESEADLDVEWSGAVAKGATIKLVVTAPTNATEGVDLSAVYAVENSVAPVISESFGECELFLGTTGNAFQNSIRQQAAAQGITFINSSGDEGSARCDPTRMQPPAPAAHGLAVSGLASSPYGVAVGGTDFQNFGANFTFGVASPYWSLSNNAQQASALGYIPETTWNSTCTNNVFVILHYGTSAEGSCNSPNSNILNFVDTVAGGGGKSSCTTSDGTNPSSCTGGYAKPVWQSAPGVPADSARDIPDVSLFASPGFMDSSYIICEADELPSPQPCSLSSAFNTFLGIGGTSASAPAFAGIMALVNQSTNSIGQGNANYVLYKMASSHAQTSLPCGSTSSPSPSCIFHDVTAGVNAVPCAKGSPNCNPSGSDQYGVLPGYTAGSGYDLTTGLGSVNATNLLHNWIQPANSSSTTLSLNNGKGVSITHGQSVNFDITVTPSAATGVVSLEGTPTGAGSVPTASFPLQSGAATGTTGALAGGTSYSVKAHYSGDGTYQPSDSNAVMVTVAPETSKTIITVPTFDATTGRETGNTPATFAYGTLSAIRVDVGNAQASQTFPERDVCVLLSCPTGAVTLTDSLSGGAPTSLNPAGVFPLNSGGYAWDYNVPLLPGGVHHLAASYAGDNSYESSSTGNYVLTVTPAPSNFSALNLLGLATIGNPLLIQATVSSNVYSGVQPTGTLTFYDGTTLIPGSITLAAQAGTSATYPSLFGSMTANLTTSGSHQLSARYSGDANYAPATSAVATIDEVYPTTPAATANPAQIYLGQTLTVTVTVTSPSKSPPMTGTFQFYATPPIQSPAPTLSTDASGNQVLTAVVTTVPQPGTSIFVTYSGDTNYASASMNVLYNLTIPDFTMSPANPSVAVVSGQSVQTGLTVTPASNVASTVALTCDVSRIIGATCSFAPPPPLNLTNGNAASTTVTVATAPPSSSSTTTFVAVPRVKIRSFPAPTQGLLVLVITAAMSLLSLISAGRKRRVTASLGLAGLACLLLSCGGSSANNVNGGGGGGGGNGGGGGGPSPTSITLTTSALKVPVGGTFTLTATLHATNSASGYVNFLDPTSGLGVVAGAPVVNGTATAQVSYITIGTHTLGAQYLGDSNNQGSQTAGSINVVITGTASVYVYGSTSILQHYAFFNVAVQ